MVPAGNSRQSCPARRLPIQPSPTTKLHRHLDNIHPRTDLREVFEVESYSPWNPIATITLRSFHLNRLEKYRQMDWIESIQVKSSSDRKRTTTL